MIPEIDRPRSLKEFLKKFIPQKAILFRRKILETLERKEHDRKFLGQSHLTIFSSIYQEGRWGRLPQESFCSGHGSHLPSHVSPYVVAVSEYLARFSSPPDVVDLGCGDFHVGSQIRNKAARYIACDIVPSLIAWNRLRFKNSMVDFRVVDIVQDPLPQGDVAILRQVLQHLSNQSIENVLKKLGAFRYLIVTEFVPQEKFKPNIDQPTGAFSRLARGIPSGVVLTQPPFNLQVKHERLLCTTPEASGKLEVIAYEMLTHA